LIPFSPLADTLKFESLPLDFFSILAVMVITYLALVEVGKYWFFQLRHPRGPLARRKPPHQRRIHRRAHRWSRRRLAARAAAEPTTVVKRATKLDR
jgi:Mg2+-importing ATPase